jgi:hypothetical protein
MRYILAVDPGTFESAFVYWDAENTNILEKGILKNMDMIRYIQASRHDATVIEMVASYGMPVGREVFETCVWIGRFYQASREPVHLIYRKEVKSFLCGSMKAKDGHIRQSLIDIVGPQGTKASPGPTYKVHADEWAALAVAVSFCGTHKERDISDTFKTADEVL